MNKALSTALFVVGVIFLIGGIKASESATSDLSRLLGGSTSGSAMWRVAGGIVFAIIGAIELGRAARKRV